MSEAIPERKRAFLRWLALGAKKREAQTKRAIAAFLPTLKAAGFEWIEKSFDGVSAQVNAIELERENVEGQIDFVSIIFDKHRRPKFQIALGTKEKAFPHRWVRGGRVVWHKNGLDKHNWWGAKWWHLNKEDAFDAAVKEVTGILPQAIDFLSNGAVGSNIWESKIGNRP
jgi:hypothetical protein